MFITTPGTDSIYEWSYKWEAYSLTLILVIHIARSKKSEPPFQSPKPLLYFQSLLRN